jgi:hypothetical protein
MPLTIDRGVKARWCARWIDPWTGAQIDRYEWRATAAGDALAVPEFTRDVALRMDRGPCPA